MGTRDDARPIPHLFSRFPVLVALPIDEKGDRVAASFGLDIELAGRLPGLAAERQARAELHPVYGAVMTQLEQGDFPHCRDFGPV